MPSAATTGMFTGNLTNVAFMLGQKLGSRSNSNGIPSVFLITNDKSEQESLKSLFAREGWRFQPFESVQEFLAQPRPLVPSCLVISLPDRNSLEGQKQIARERLGVPIIIISTQRDVQTSVEAMKAGAVDFLVTPFSNEILLSGVRESFERSRMILEREMEISGLRNCYASLTRRERQVMVLVVSGLLNKQVGGELGISEITVKAHRKRVMRKMKADSLPHLVRMAVELRPARLPIPLAQQRQLA